MGFVNIFYTKIDQIEYSDINRAILNYNFNDFQNFNEYKSYLENLNDDEQCDLYDYLDEEFGGQLGKFKFLDLIKDEKDINDLKKYFDGLVE